MKHKDDIWFVLHCLFYSIVGVTIYHCFAYMVR